MRWEDLVRQRQAIFEIAARHGVTDIRVFGSVARGDARPDSDLDLLVEVGGKTTPFFPGGLIADLQEMLGCRVEVVTKGGIYWYIRDQVLQEAVPL